MEKAIKLFTYDSRGDVPFPSVEEQVVINSFEYHANRMGGTPYISGVVKHRLCLDNMWNDKVYGLFRGERFYVINTPSSSKNNTDERYEHDVQLLSEREVLNHVYFLDVVASEEKVSCFSSGIWLMSRLWLNNKIWLNRKYSSKDIKGYKSVSYDRNVSNSSKFQFVGDIKQFVGRLNNSLQKSNLNYLAVLDEGISSESKYISFENKYITEALQESFKIWQIPYYFEGRTIHFGFKDNAIPIPMKYGSTEALLSVSKTNANYKVINRITGTGSEKNIPYYYPNESEKGQLGIEANQGNKSLKTEDVHIVNALDFAKVKVGKDIIYNIGKSSYVGSSMDFGDGFVKNTGQQFFLYSEGSGFYFKARIVLNIQDEGSVKVYPKLHTNKTFASVKHITFASVDSADKGYELDESDNSIVFHKLDKGERTISLEYHIPYTNTRRYDCLFFVDVKSEGYWSCDGKYFSLESNGLEIKGTPSIGDGFKQKIVGWITPSQKLMPSIYRESRGDERFYNAKNNTYPTSEGGFYDFENEFSEGKQLEGIVEFPDIEPTIKGMTNASGLRIDMFSEFAYDESDDDSYDEEKGEYTHSYFFAKLRKTDGDFGFNLFDHANEKQTMQVSMLKGVCGACTFEIGVGEETQKNIVQVDEQGNLLRDEKGNVIRSGIPQDRQNDTIHYEVWIALKKDENTYPTFKPMPNATTDLRPSVDDNFVLLGITLPDAYIRAAEKKLDDSLIKHMWMNNMEKFNFSQRFSRIYFAEHPEVLEQIDENARLLIEYNGKQHTLYIDDFSYKVDANIPLPEVEVNLVDTLTIGKNSLQTALDSIKQDILSTMGGGDFLKLGLKYFLRKDVPDATRFLLRLLGGAEIGRFINGQQGTKIDTLGNMILHKIQSHGFSKGALGTGFVLQNDPKTGRSYLEVDELFVRVKAFFAELEIKKLSYAGGNWIFSPAGMTCSDVEEFDDYYRCYFVDRDKDVKVTNDFRVDDQVRCQEFNIKEGVSQNVQNRYFWRLCVSVGENYIDLSKTDRDDRSNSAPQKGDSLVCLGNRTDKNRQNAIVISAYGEGSPSITQHNGINSYTLKGTEKTRISPEKNRFTGEFIFESGQSVEEYIEGTEINGRNLIRNSQIVLAQYNSSFGSGKWINERPWLMKDVWTMAYIQLGSEYSGVGLKPTIPIQPNQSYMLTVEFSSISYGGKTETYDVGIYDHTSKNLLVASRMKVGNERQIVQLVTNSNVNPKHDNQLVLFTGDMSSSKGRSMMWNNVKLEKGDKATPWSFAPEDAIDRVDKNDEKIKNALENAENAKKAAENAEKESLLAKERLDLWASDGVISPTEKLGIKEEITRIDADKDNITQGYNRYFQEDPILFLSAYSIYREQLLSLSKVEPEIIDIPKNFAFNQAKYYEQRTNVLNAINEAAQSYVDNGIIGIRKDYDAKFEATSKRFESYLTLETYGIDKSGVDKRLSKAESDIKQTAEAINLKVSKETYDTDKQGIESRLSSAESNITQNATNISLSVTKTEYEKDSAAKDEQLAQANREIEANKAALKVVESDIENIKKQTDGAIETWFYDPVPTLDNEPAVNWKTEEDKKKHEGDLYYDANGQSYRFAKRDGAYKWELIQDSGLSDALKKIEKAQATADGKMKVFVRQPDLDSSYQEGDLWVNATYPIERRMKMYTNDLLRCIQGKNSGEAFNIDHWELASKYTDDTKANAVDKDLTETKKTYDSKFLVTEKEISSKVSITDYNGNTIASLINQDATSVSIDAKHISLTGAVTFSDFSVSTQNTINGKANKSELGSLAYLSSIGMGNLDKDTKDTVEGAMQEKTYINGGFIKTSYIDVNNLYVTKLAANEGTIGAFKVDEKGLHSVDSTTGAYITIGDENDWSVNRRNFYTLNRPDSEAFMSTWSNYQTALDTRCAAKGKSALNAFGTNGAYAIKSEGNVLLDGSMDGQVRIAGLSLAALNGNEVRNNINFYIIPNNTTYFNLPSPSTMNGNILFVKLMGKTTIRSYSPIYRPDTNGTFKRGSDMYYWDTFTERSLIFLNNGDSWYCFGCYSY